jgi:hypothetical protein
MPAKLEVYGNIRYNQLYQILYDFRQVIPVKKYSADSWERSNAMVNQSITEGVIRTRSKLRRDLLISIFDEFDGSIMDLSPDRRTEKYRTMAQSAFSFYRGSAYLFYFDTTRQYFPYHSSPSRPTWIQGDLHFENFGAFRSEEGTIVYDVNDFDEGYVGSYLYDLLRMAVSIALVGRQFGLGLGQADQHKLIRSYAETYFRQIHRFCEHKDNPGNFVVNKDTAKGPVKRLLRKLENIADRDELTVVIRQMGSLTAKMHARADADKGILDYHSEQEIAKAMGADPDAFARYIAEWAYGYAGQVEKDFAMFADWVSEHYGI